MSLTLPGLKREMRPMLASALPVALGELGWMAMGVIDVMMVGRLSPEAIGAVGMGRALFWVIAVPGIGMLLGLDTLISQAFGAGNLKDCHRSLLHGVYFSLAMALPATCLALAGAPLLANWGLDPEVLAESQPYLRAIAWSSLPIFLYASFRRYLQGINRVRSIMIALISANVINALCNWLFIFGNWGAPKLGVEGAGWATVASTLYMAGFLAMTIVLHDRGERHKLSETPLRLEPARMKKLFALGLPSSLQLLLELGVFALATALAGRLDAISLAAHQIALTAASVTFMVPLGISSAGAVRVGQAIGRKDPAGAGDAGWVALVLGSAFMVGAAVIFVAMPRTLIRLFTTDPAVISMGITLLAIAAVFQLFDGFQVVATGNLRGAGNTRTPMLWNLVGHWAVGLPVGYWLAFVRGWGVVGIWAGLCLGLMLIGIVLARVWVLQVRSLSNSAISG
jgi:MATE family multidrug resistance protein